MKIRYYLDFQLNMEDWTCVYFLPFLISTKMKLKNKRKTSLQEPQRTGEVTAAHKRCWPIAIRWKQMEEWWLVEGAKHEGSAGRWMGSLKFNTESKCIGTRGQWGSGMDQERFRDRSEAYYAGQKDVGGCGPWWKQGWERIGRTVSEQSGGLANQNVCPGQRPRNARIL